MWRQVKRAAVCAAMLLAAACDAPVDPVVAVEEAVETTAGPLGDDPFEDVGSVVGLDYLHFNGMTGERYAAETMSPGVALFDYDHDGDLDLYFRQGRLLAPSATYEEALLPPTTELGDRLYRSDLVLGGRFRLVDRSRPSNLGFSDYGMGVATGDFDRDGWMDLYLTAQGTNRLLRNLGDGTFVDVTEAAGVDDTRLSQSAVFFDADADGWLDLFVTNWVDFSLETHKECFTPANASLDYCGPQSYRPEPDRFWRNLGDGTFRDATGVSGLAGAHGSGLGVVARDFDGDARLDLYVANDGLENLLWHNQGDRFEEIALLAGGAVNGQGDREGSMGLVADDLDGDGDVDLFMTHLLEETNTFLVNDGAGYLSDRTAKAGLAVPSRGKTGFGAVAIDLENDGLLDLLTVNGAVRVIPEQEAAGDVLPLRQTNQLFRNLGQGNFREVSDSSPSVAGPLEVSRAAAHGDLDGNGTTDVVITNNAGPAQLLLNRGAEGASWIGFDLIDWVGHVDAAGSRLLVAVGGKKILRHVAPDGSYLAASSRRLSVGLGREDWVESVETRWPDGRRLRLERLAAGRYYVIGRPGQDG